MEHAYRKTPVPAPAPLAEETTAQRRALIAAAPSALGAAWASELSESLRVEGRPIDGGWPGTTQEARARVLQHFYRELSRLRLTPLAHGESEAVTTATYEQARGAWLELVRIGRKGRRKGDAG